ncbi:thiamine phosphate synthase [Vogesella oryzae]|uniref:thiamine phosphate synthase n=1 Tax=Vogesella oryzae TaxID=1735285 RepID=UPI0015837E4E|nr:thiamine phosphate synthase [Vogesella oryzae]
MPNVSGLYVITPDTDDTEQLIEQVSAALDGGARVLQYRNKSNDTVRRLWQANILASLARSRHALFIINDDIELARAVNADGVHVGRNDAAIAAARAALGPAALIGASCYNSLALARAAVAAGANYVAFGAVFSSGTKPEAVHAPLELFAQSADLGVPRVAIGGITPANAGQVVAAGADAIAVIGGLFDGDGITERAIALAALFD